MTKLSVNINKIATIRNARGGEIPNLVNIAKLCEEYGADGITIHPRPDERHIRQKDVYDLAAQVTTEFNIEGYPSISFLELIDEIRPTQCTLVPDPPHVLTSNAGWIINKNEHLLKSVTEKLQKTGTRVSLFMDPVTTTEEDIKKLNLWGVDRIELYTEAFAKHFPTEERDQVTNKYINTAILATKHGVELNAGHDLDLNNLSYFVNKVPNIKEVSIGHALISDALLLGLNKCIKKYKACIS